MKSTHHVEGRRESILLLADVEALLGRTSDTLRTYVAQGRLPRPRRLGHALFWSRSELEACLAGAPPAGTWPGPADRADVDGGDTAAAPELQEEAEAA